MIASTPVMVRWLVTRTDARPTNATGSMPSRLANRMNMKSGEDIGREVRALRTDVGVHHVGDEAGEALDRHLPAAGHQLALHAAAS